MHVDDTLDSHLNAPMYCFGSGCTPVTPWTGTAALGTMTAGSSADIVIKATIDPGTPDGYVIDNTATIASSTADPNGANNTSTTHTTVSTAADLSITKSDSSDPVTAGNKLTYTITVTNAGPSTARNVQITDPVPAGTTFFSADGAGNNVANTVTWNVGNLAPGSTTVHMTVTVDPHRKTGLWNSATVTSTTTDPTPSDHTATETTAVTPVTTVAITSWTNPVTSGNQTNVSASGTAEASDTVSLTITDGTNTVGPFTTTAVGGNWSLSGMNVSSLSDGTITYSATATDGFGGTANDSKTAAKDTVTNVSITNWTDPINAGNQTNVSASGTAEAADTVKLTISDAGNAHSVGPFTTTATGGHWSFSGIDVSSLNDGTITYSVTATDGVGNAATDSETATKDTVAPTVTINQALTQSDPTSMAPIKFTVVFSEPVTGFANNETDLSSSTAGGMLTSNPYDSGDHMTYEVKVNGMTTAGDIIAKINANTAVDAAGNGNVVSTSTDNEVTWQPTAGNNTPTAAAHSSAAKRPDARRLLLRSMVVA